MKPIATLLMLLTACSTAPEIAVAYQVTNPNDLPGGPDAAGAVGDWLIGNDVITVVVDDVSHQNAIAPGGGTVIDFAHRGANDDQLVQVYQVFGVSQDESVRYDTINADVFNNTAQLAVSGHIYVANANAPVTSTAGVSLQVSTTYTLSKGEEMLHVATTLVNTGAQPVPAPAVLDDIWVWGNRSLQPFAPYAGRGFNQPNIAATAVLEGLGSYLYMGARGFLGPPISYGTVAPNLPGGQVVGLNTGQLSALGASPLSRSPLPVGGSVTLQRHFLMGATASIESIASTAMRIVYRDAPGSVAPLGALVGRLVGMPAGRSVDVVAQTQAGMSAPVNAATVRAPDDGFYLTLPAGTYTLLVTLGSLPAQTVGPFTVTAGALTSAGAISLPALGTLQYTITSDGQALPARLTVKGQGNADPQLGPAFTGAVSGQVAYSLTGSGSVTVEPGTYDVFASRGPNTSLGHQVVTISPNTTTSATFALLRVVNTDGWLAADLHVHGQASLDSSLDLPARVTAMAGEDLAMVVMTDHDALTDLTPTVQALQLTQQLRTQVGVETTAFISVPTTLPATIGHNNGWPLTVQPGAVHGGAPADERIEPALLYERMRAAASAPPVVQLNHPYSFYIGDVGLGYFSNFHFNPTVPIPQTDTGGTNSFLRRATAQGHDNLSFDAMEILNAAGLDSFLYSINNRDAWLALLKQGWIRTGTANSDSHTAGDTVGFPRNYVNVPTPADLSTLDTHAVNAALLQHQSQGSSGPFIEAAIGGVGPGGTVNTGAAGNANVNIDITVQAAAWIAVDEVRVVLNGNTVCSITAAGVTGAQAAGCPAGLAPNPNDPYDSSGAQRYAATAALNISQDSFVLVEAGVQLPPGKDLDNDGNVDTWDCNNDGSIDPNDTAACLAQRTGASAPVSPLLMAPTPGSLVVPGLMPWAFTNPILIHLGDPAGAWQPPGL